MGTHGLLIRGKLEVSGGGGWDKQTQRGNSEKGQRPVEQNRLMGKATELRTHSHIHTNTETWRYIKL